MLLPRTHRCRLMRLTRSPAGFARLDLSGLRKELIDRGLEFEDGRQLIVRTSDLLELLKTDALSFLDMGWERPTTPVDGPRCGQPSK